MSNMYEFFLPNTDFGLGDQMTVGQVSVSGHLGERKVCDRIDFEIGGRKWCLRKLGILGVEDLPMDVAFAKAKAMGDEHAKIGLRVVFCRWKVVSHQMPLPRSRATYAGCSTSLWGKKHGGDSLFCATE